MDFIFLKIIFSLMKFIEGSFGKSNFSCRLLNLATLRVGPVLVQEDTEPDPARAPGHQDQSQELYR